MGVSNNRGPCFGCPHNKSPFFGGSILGLLIFGNSHMWYGFYLGLVSVVMSLDGVT